MTGYLHPDYAASFAEWGRPCPLEGSGGWLIERDVPGHGARDAMGPYPLFTCSRWDGLAADLDAARDRWVAVSLVADPMSAPAGTGWHGAFDQVVSYRDHYVVETGSPDWESLVHARHRKHARRALDMMTVRRLSDPAAWVDPWDRLFGVLAERHQIRGIRRFSRRAFARQLAVPGMVAFVAERDGVLLGMDLWYVHGAVAHGHLAAFSGEGYECHASYATKWSLLKAFAADGIRWVNLGGAARPGLRSFKAGWTPHTRVAHLCTRVLQPDKYAELARAVGRSGDPHFPAYRAGEFA